MNITAGSKKGPEMVDCCFLASCFPAAARLLRGTSAALALSRALLRCVIGGAPTLFPMLRNLPGRNFKPFQA